MTKRSDDVADEDASRQVKLKVVDEADSTLRPEDSSTCLRILAAASRGTSTLAGPSWRSMRSRGSLSKARFKMRGWHGRSAYSSTHRVTVAHRPTDYVTESEISYEDSHQPWKRVGFVERNRISASSAGSTVHYEAYVIYEWNAGILATLRGVIAGRFHPTRVDANIRASLRRILRAAEREARRREELSRAG